ncbi:MAG: hypothetical protein AABY07_06185 [Nanoarchaeota archaeon]
MAEYNKKTRGFLGEFILNFALVYSTILGATLIPYAIYRGFFSPMYYLLAFVIFIVYFSFWTRDKIMFVKQ